ncbi:AAA family ATPase [Mycobacteroides abscessus]|uniref:AAA family ATPase n=1 Tax=Mycobacteroides abscessus TaxID=36809 RepID=UPI000C268661|nr:AAA family ATPase [Mycobacteroides abscessus]
MSDRYEKLLGALRDIGSTVRESSAGQAMAQCPAHDDSNPSLSVTDTGESVLVYCHAKCDVRDVIAAVGLSMADLFAAKYEYPDGRVVTRSYKLDGSKAFQQVGNKSGRALYGSDRLDGAQSVYVVEGEKDVDSLRAVGGVGVCSAMGAQSAAKFDWSPLHGKSVVIVADDDAPGMKYAASVASILGGHADVQVMKAAVGKDISDHIAAGKSLDELVPLSEQIETLSREAEISSRMDTLAIDREARRRLDEQDRPPITAPGVTDLSTLLATPDITAEYSISGVAPAGGRVMLSAQYKAGKSTLVGNVVRSRVDQTPFLERFEVSSPARSVVLIDTELSEGTLRRWLRDQNIVNASAVSDVVALRGRVGAFDLIDRKRRAEWVARLRALRCDYLILDCLRPVLDALGLDEHRDAGRFLVAFDALLSEAAVADALVVHHMGHSNERARGDSRLQDWPDALWRLVRENDEPGSARFFSAYGRDVDVREGRLTFDPDTRHLSYVDGSRTDSKAEAAKPDVLAVLAEAAKSASDGLSGRQIEDALKEADHSRGAIRDALKALVALGVLATADGARRSKLHRIANPCRDCGYPLAAGQESNHIECGRTLRGAA